MKMQENHKEFTDKCFVEYMTLRDVVDAFKNGDKIFTHTTLKGVCKVLVINHRNSL